MRNGVWVLSKGRDADEHRSWLLRGALLAVALVLGTVGWLGVAGVADAHVPQEAISSAGPMTRIYLDDDLACQVMMANDAYGVFYGPGDTDPGACGTFMQVNASKDYNDGDAILFGPSVPGGPGSLEHPAPTVDYTPVSQTMSETATTFRVTTIVNACAKACGDRSELAQLTETDTYIVGSDEYDTILQIENKAGEKLTGMLYHTGDCDLVVDEGYGALGGTSANAPECTLTPNDSPPGRIASFIPVAGPVPSFYEGPHLASESPMDDSFWGYVTPAGTPYPDTIDATSDLDNGMGLSWKYSLAAAGSTSGTSTTIRFDTLVDPNDPPSNAVLPVITGLPVPRQPLTCSQGSWTSAAPIMYTYQWLQDGTAIAGATSSTYTVPSGGAGQSLACQVTANTNDGGTATTSAAVTVTAFGAPSVSPGPTSAGSQRAGFTAAVNPNGSATSVYFEYGLDPKYGLTTASDIYVGRTPVEAVGSGSSPKTVFAGVTGLVPDALYHVRAVAANAVGTVTSADQTFTTAALAPPPVPVLGQEANFTPVSGIVYVKPPAGASIAGVDADRAGFGPDLTGHAMAALTKGMGFIPLTEARQLPVGTEVDARAGTLRLITATTARKKGKRTQTESGEFSEGLFQVAQSDNRRLKGLTLLKLLDSGIFPGAPSYKKECAAVAKTINVPSGVNGDLVFKPRKLSKKALQTLKASEHGNYRTQGKYSAATVRGTIFTVTDRCDGTLTVVKRGLVVVTDFRRHKNITLHTNQRYLATAP